MLVPLSLDVSLPIALKSAFVILICTFSAGVAFASRFLLRIVELFDAMLKSISPNVEGIVEEAAQQISGGSRAKINLSHTY